MVFSKLLVRINFAFCYYYGLIASGKLNSYTKAEICPSGCRGASPAGGPCYSSVFTFSQVHACHTMKAVMMLSSTERKT